MQSKPSIEKYSGLKTSSWRLRPEKWETLMRDRKYVPFDRISSLNNVGMENEKDTVLIGTLYEKGIAKTGAKGGRFIQWGITDLAFPKPFVVSVFLHNQAFEEWGMEVEGVVRHGAVVALLNPTFLPQTNPPAGSKGDGSSRAAVRIMYSTQLVILGDCPSLGYCSWSKKDGMKCSMPCNLDRGPNVCFFHSLQKATTCNKKFAPMGLASGGGGGKPATPVLDSRLADLSGVTVIQGPRAKTGQQASAEPARPVRLPMESGIGGAHGRKSAKDKGDLALESLLKTRPAAQGRSVLKQRVEGQPAAKAATPERPTTQVPSSGALGGALPVRTPASSSGPEAAKAPAAVSPKFEKPPEYGAVPVLLKPAGLGPTTEESKEQADLRRRLLAKFPKGLPEPGGRPTSQPSHVAAVMKLAAAQKDVAVLRKPPPKFCPQERKIVKRTTVASKAAAAVAKKSGLDLAATPGVPKADPRKDLVRSQTSRFSGLVDQERAAKRQRILNEMEAQDAIKEKMEALMSLEVNAWRCDECMLTSESTRKREDCQARGHTTKPCTVTKTRWECIGCKHYEFVYDRVLPDRCTACGGAGWRQTPLQGVARTALMERDHLLARGEEMKFLNSIPANMLRGGGGGGPSREKNEADDPYQAMDASW